MRCGVTSGIKTEVLARGDFHSSFGRLSAAFCCFSWLFEVGQLRPAPAPPEYGCRSLSAGLQRHDIFAHLAEVRGDVFQLQDISPVSYFCTPASVATSTSVAELAVGGAHGGKSPCVHTNQPASMAFSSAISTPSRWWHSEHAGRRTS